MNACAVKDLSTTDVLAACGLAGEVHQMIASESHGAVYDCVVAEDNE
jgi:hypothetical protein